MKDLIRSNPLKLAALVIFFYLSLVSSSHAQTYETSLTTTNYIENFNELSAVNCSDNLPAGWVMAEGVGLPNYSGALASTNQTIFTTNLPANFTTYSIINAGGNDGSGCPHDVTAPTFGGRINFGDAATGYGDRAIGFMSSNPSWESPTNDSMFGFYNNMGSNIIALSITNNIKQYRLNTNANSATVYQVTFYYSTDGSNWTHYAGGDCGPMVVGASTNYFYTSGPIVSNKSFTLNNLNIANGAPLYLDWHFVIATANGSFSVALGLDDVGLNATLGTPASSPSINYFTGNSGNWSTATNWLSNSIPINGNNLIFSNYIPRSVNLVTNDLSNVTNFGYISFASGPLGGFLLSGNPIILNSGITNNATFTEYIALPITLTSDEYFCASASPLVFSGYITNGGNQVIFTGASSFTNTGSIVGTGKLTMAGTGTLNLGGTNTYSGATSLNSGTTKLTSSNGLPPLSAVTVGLGATLDLNTNNAVTQSLSGGGTLILSTNKSLTLLGNGGSFSGYLTGPGSLNVSGNGVQAISGTTNNSTGPITVTSGTLQITATAVLGSGPLILAGGDLQLTGTRDVTNGILTNAFILSSNSIVQNTTSATAGTRNFPFGGPVIATNGTLTIQTLTTGNYTNVLNLRFYGPVTNFTQPIVFDNSLSANTTNNTLQLGSWNTNGTAAQVFSGPISGPGAFYRDSLVPGAGAETDLSGSNTYTLGTIVARGYLGVLADSFLSGTNLVAGPLGTGILTIDDDTVNGLPGTGIAALGAPRTVQNTVVLNGNNTNYYSTMFYGSYPLTFAGPFNAGLSVPKNIVLSNSALTTISGAIFNPALITIAGPGALALTADNTSYQGAFTIAGGTLFANNTTGTATGTNVLTIAGGTVAGTGIIAGPVVLTNNGIIAPGYAVGTLTLQSNLDFSAGGSYAWKIGANSASNPGVDFSQLAVTGGNVVLTGASVLRIQLTNTASAGNAFWQSAHSWRILTLSGGATISGTGFSSVVNGSSVAGTFTTSVDASGVLLNFAPATTASKPGINLVTVFGGQITFSGTNGTSGAGYSVLSATNLTTPLSNWVSVASGNFSSNGRFTNSLAISGTEPRRVYLLKLQ